VDCIYLAAGLSVRMKKTLPKQFLTLLGKPILVYALEVLEKVDFIENILVIYHPEFKSLYEEIIKDYNISKCTLVEGGRTRQESVFNGLKHVKTKRVIIHEAARPFITTDFITELANYDEKAVVPTIPIPFTVSEGQKYMQRQLDRSVLHNIQLPQIFDTETLIKAHKATKDEDFAVTEDSMLVFRSGEKVLFVGGLENNIKITTPLQLIVAESLLKGAEL